MGKPPLFTSLARAQSAHDICINMKASRRNRTRGTARELKGHAKEKTGRMIGNRRMEAEDRLQRGAGKLQRKVGEAEDLAEE